MAHFFIDESLAHATTGDRVTLAGAEGRHAAAVSRLRVGETVSLGNGRGLVCQVVVSATEKDSVEFEVQDVAVVAAPTHPLVLAQALAKSDRDERAVEASVELGVDAVIPFAADRSVSRWDATKVAKGRARWQTIAREASKQSLRAWVPEVEELATCDDLLRRPGARIVVLDATGEPMTSRDWTSAPSATLSPGNVATHTVFVVGPEGGFSDGEREQFHRAGALFVRLGHGILRTSTAGPVALGLVQALSGHWA